MKEPTEAQSDLDEPRFGERAELAEHSGAGDGHQPMEANGGRDAQSGLAEVRVLGAERDVGFQVRWLSPTGDEGDHDVAGWSNGFGEADRGSHLGSGEVVERERDEYDFTAGH